MSFWNKERKWCGYGSIKGDLAVFAAMIAFLAVMYLLGRGYLALAAWSWGNR